MKIFTNSQHILEQLEKLNLHTSEDILNYLPYRYEDNSYTDLSEIFDKQKITVIGKLVSSPKHFHNGKLDIITFFFITNDGHFFNVKVFNRGYLMTQLKLGEEFSITGIYQADKKEINAQSIIKGILTLEKTFRPVYHLNQGLTQSTYRKLVQRTYEKVKGVILDVVPFTLRQKYHLLSKQEALKRVHFPISEEDVHFGLRTLKYHECLAYSLKNLIIRGENKRPAKQPKKPIPLKEINQFILDLSFKLTKDQILAVREIILDMNQVSLMYRLLQGDVGTGKTIVSTIALYGNYLRGKVGAFLAPTDSLARQQYESLKKDLSKYGITVDLLIGGLSTKEKNRVKQDLKEGKIHVIVGTHALFSKDVEYASLGLAIIDEQHRFGVNQRNMLLSKDDSCDLLLMSATPIPRTLALSIYGDLDITSLVEFPNKERKVITKVVSSKSSEIFSLIRECLDSKRQVFVVAPKIVGEGLTSVEQIYDLYQTLFKEQVKLLHGKMKSEEKEQVLSDFIHGKFHILVATTVIELGINVLNAGAMIIYGASSFGLASLHQLRGRVGRDGQEATCLLIDDEEEHKRLDVLVESNDGFYIAQQDMQMRGPGDAFGTSQSGFPTFNTLNIVDDFRMFECARKDALEILNHLEILENKTFHDFVLYEMTNEEVKLFD